jgi:hypothetical protein
MDIKDSMLVDIIKELNQIFKILKNILFNNSSLSNNSMKNLNLI